MIGKVFDNSSHYSQNKTEVKKLIHYYFTEHEIKNKVILDAGCRVGDYSLALKQMGAQQVVGVDLSQKCIKIARQRYKKSKNLKFYVSNISKLSMFKRSSFDVVFCIGTINYLNLSEARQVIAEFKRIIRPGGVILILFQKEKGWPIRSIRFLANILPLKVYLFLIENFSFSLLPLMPLLVGRKISLNYLKYDILLSLRGLNFGIPLKIDEKFRERTLTCEQCSEVTTASYKIIVSKPRV